MCATRRARLDGGCLNVYTTRGGSPGSLVMLALRALFGRLRQAEDFVESKASALRVTSRKPREVTVLLGRKARRLSAGGMP